jgi:hypothetical protein
MQGEKTNVYRLLVRKSTKKDTTWKTKMYMGGNMKIALSIRTKMRRCKLKLLASEQGHVVDFIKYRESRDSIKICKFVAE